MHHKLENPRLRVFCEFLVLKNSTNQVLGVLYYPVRLPVLFRITT